MNKIRVNAHGMKEYEKKLGLKWRVEYVRPEQEREGATCQIHSDPNEKFHEVWIHTGVMDNPDFFLQEVVHELCHGKLAEDVDINFSTLYFSEKYKNTSPQEKSIFMQKGRMLHFANAHKDIWVNDLRHKYWPELTKMDTNLFMQMFYIGIKEKRWELFEMPETSIGLAMQQAEYKRYNINVDAFAEIRKRGVAVDDTIKALAEYYTSLPKLKFVQRKDVKLLLRSVKDVIKIMKFPIEPILVYERNMWVWEI